MQNLKTKFKNERQFQKGFLKTLNWQQNDMMKDFSKSEMITMNSDI